MCGFVGVFGNHSDQYPIDEYGRLISYRGPDSHAVFQTHSFHVNFSRLAILPPLQHSGISEYRESVLVLNGEIYFENLNGLTDAEYLHRMIFEDGFSILEKINGQFAFALFMNQKLYLGRDHLGIKPLYYTTLPSGDYVFASEMKALSQMPHVKKDLNIPVVESFQGLGYNIFPGETCFCNIRSVNPGELLEFSLDRRIVRTSFFEFDVPETQYDIDLEHTNAIETELEQGIQRCLLHDPNNSKAIFYSGGLDSSYLLARGNRICDLAPYTLWDSINGNDVEDARLLCKTLGISLNENKIDWDMLDRMIVHYAWHFEMPIGGSGFDLLGGLAFHLLAQIISKEGYRVALCGEGADELFLGYHQYHMNPEILKDKLSLTIRNRNLKHLEKRLSELDFFRNTDSSARFIAIRYGLSEYHLQSVDRSGMAFGLEIRPPFVNYRLETMLRRIKSDCLIDRNDSWTKVLLRSFFKKIVPQTEARCAVRRKRAMAYSVLSFENILNDYLKKNEFTLTLSEAFWRLFFYLHVYHDFKVCPEIPFSKLVYELERIEPPL